MAASQQAGASGRGLHARLGETRGISQTGRAESRQEGLREGHPAPLQVSWWDEGSR